MYLQTIYYICSMLNLKTDKMENLKDRLWDERGYDISYLNNLNSKELKSLYDTEFYYED